MGAGLWGVLCILFGLILLWLSFTGRGGQVNQALFGAVQTVATGGASASSTASSGSGG